MNHPPSLYPNVDANARTSPEAISRTLYPEGRSNVGTLAHALFRLDSDRRALAVYPAALQHRRCAGSVPQIVLRNPAARAFNRKLERGRLCRAATVDLVSHTF